MIQDASIVSRRCGYQGIQAHKDVRCGFNACFPFISRLMRYKVRERKAEDDVVFGACFALMQVSGPCQEDKGWRRDTRVVGMV